MYNEKLEVKLKYHDDMWQYIKDCAMTTISKNTGKYPDSEWKRKLLLSEHSPIRIGKILSRFTNIYSFVATHFTRHHIGCEKFVSSRRTDRSSETDTNRSSLVNMDFEANFQSIINISRKRLCSCASLETTFTWMEYLENVVKLAEPELYSVCVPDCIYRGYCYEIQSCGYHKSPEFQEKLKKYRENINQ